MKTNIPVCCSMPPGQKKREGRKGGEIGTLRLIAKKAGVQESIATTKTRD